MIAYGELFLYLRSNPGVGVYAVIWDDRYVNDKGEARSTATYWPTVDEALAVLKTALPEHTIIDQTQGSNE